VSSVIGRSGPVTIRRRNDESIALEFGDPPRPYVTVSPELYKHLTVAIKKAGVSDGQGKERQR
jgi:hypothetical protein